jgi:hypothetical protein
VEETKMTMTSTEIDCAPLEEEEFDAMFSRVYFEQQAKKRHKRRRASSEKETKLWLVDDETEAEGKGILVTVGEFSSESRIPRSTIKKRIREGRLKVKKIPGGQGKAGFRYMIWVESPWLKEKVLIARRNKIVEMNVTHSTLVTLHEMSKIDKETYDKILSNRGPKFQVTFVVPEKILLNLLENSTVHNG